MTIFFWVPGGKGVLSSPGTDPLIFRHRAPLIPDVSVSNPANVLPSFGNLMEQKTIRQPKKTSKLASRNSDPSTLRMHPIITDWPIACKRVSRRSIVS